MTEKRHSEDRKYCGELLADSDERNAKEKTMWTWLAKLRMTQYHDKIQTHFECDYAQIAACKQPGSSWCERLDPEFFKVLGVQKMGHKMLLSKAIHELTQPRCDTYLGNSEEGSDNGK